MKVSTLRNRYGIYGNFEGDDVLEERLKSFEASFNSANADTEQTFDQLVCLANDLPPKGRQELSNSLRNHCALCDLLLVKLLDYCLTIPSAVNDEDITADEEFIYIASSTPKTSTGIEEHASSSNRNLVAHPLHYPQWQVLLALLPFANAKVAANICSQYLDSCSTRYRSSILNYMVANPEVSNDKLVDLYKTETKKGQISLLKQIVKIRRDQEAHELLERRVFALEALLDQKLVSNPGKYIYDTSSAYLTLRIKKDPSMLYKKWIYHKDIYISILRERLESCRIKRQNEEKELYIDWLKCGKIWNNFVSRISSEELDGDAAERLFQLMIEFQPHQVLSNQALNVIEWLKQLSANGNEDVLKLKNIVSKIELDESILVAIPKTRRKELALQSLEARNFEEFKVWANLLSRRAKTTLLEKYLQQVSGEVFWRYLLCKDLESDELDVFFNYFSNFFKNDVVGIISNVKRDVGPTMKAIQEWLRLHKRYSPVELDQDFFDQFNLEDTVANHKLWMVWYESYMTMERNYIPAIANALRKVCQTDLPFDRSRVTMYATASNLLLDESFEAIHFAQNHVENDRLLKSTWSILIDNLYRKFDVLGSQPSRLSKLMNKIEFSMNTLLHLLKNSMNLDPMVQKNYPKNMTDLHNSCNRLRNVITITKSEDVLAQCFDIAAMWFTNSKSNDYHIQLPNNQMRFFIQKPNRNNGNHQVLLIQYINQLLHSEAMAQSIELMKDILRQKHSSMTLKKKIWTILKTNSDSAKLTSDYDYVLFCCNHLPNEIQDEERQTIVKRASIEINEKKNFVQQIFFKSLDKVGSLQEVLDACGDVDEKLSESVLKDNASFVHASVQKLLKEQTLAADGKERAEGHSIWLRRAFESLSFPVDFVGPLRYTTYKIKNESAINKFLVYHTINELLPKMVKSTLVNYDEKSANSLGSLLVDMVQNDLDRRDSIAWKSLDKLPRNIMKHTIEFDPLKSALGVRRSWVQYALKISTLLVKSRGDCATFSIPLCHCNHPVSAWINHKSWIDSFTSNPTGIRLKAMKEIVHYVNLPQSVKAFESCDIFDLNKAVDMIVEELASVWDSSTYGHPFDVSLNGSTKENEHMLKHNLHRLNQLFELCSYNWEDSDYLREAFDKIFSRSLFESSEETFLIKEVFLKKIIQLSCIQSSARSHMLNYLFCHQRLVSAIDLVFRYVIDNKMKDEATYWVNIWRDCQLFKKPITFSAFDTKIQRLICRFCRYSSKKERNKLQVTDKFEFYNRQCHYLKDVLSLSSSALHLKSAWDVMLEHRPDIISKYCTDGTIDGVFKPEDAPSNAIPLLYDTIISITKLQPATAQLYANHVSKLCLDKDIDMNTRVDAMETFVSCAVTSNAQILTFLSDKSLEPPLTEAIILRIFTLDAPWYALALLLNVEVLRQRKQSTTASLLANVSRHVPISIVVKALSLLLKPSRRKVIGVVLMKAMVRMLFEAGTEVAKQLLQNELKNDEVHEDVKNEIFILCLQAIVKKKVCDSLWEWEILHNLADSEEISDEISIMLLSMASSLTFIGRIAHRWYIGLSIDPPSESQSIQDIRCSYQSETKLSTADALEKRTAFFSFTEKLSTNLKQLDLQRVAMYQKWSLADFFVDRKVFTDEQNVLKEIQSELENNSNFNEPWYDWWITGLSVLYGNGVQSCIYNAGHQHPGHHSNTMVIDDWKEIAANNQVAQDASQFIEKLIERGSKNDQSPMDKHRTWMVIESICQGAGQSLPFMTCFHNEETNNILAKQREDAACIIRVASMFTGSKNANYVGYGVNVSASQNNMFALFDAWDRLPFYSNFSKNHRY